MFAVYHRRKVKLFLVLFTLAWPIQTPRLRHHRASSRLRSRSHSFPIRTRRCLVHQGRTLFPARVYAESWTARRSHNARDGPVRTALPPSALPSRIRWLHVKKKASLLPCLGVSVSRARGGCENQQADLSHIPSIPSHLAAPLPRASNRFPISAERPSVGETFIAGRGTCIQR